MEHIAHEEQSFTINTTITFGLDDDNEPKSVTVEGPEFMTNQMFRDFATEALDSHFGSNDHDFHVRVRPYEYSDTEAKYEVKKVNR